LGVKIISRTLKGGDFMSKTMKFSPLLRYFTKEIDRRIFKQNPAPVIIFEEEKEDDQGWIVGNGYISSIDVYVIYAYVDELILGEYEAFNRIFSSWPFRKISEEYQEYISFNNVEEFVVGLAAHEVRHRVQFKLSVTLVRPEDQERATDPFLRLLIRVAELFFKSIKRVEPSSPYIRDGINKQFDAMIIEFITVKLWRKTRDLEKIAEIVGKDAKDLLKIKLCDKEGFDPSFFIMLRLVLVRLSLLGPDIYLCKAKWKA
jgi:hypothetical protein